MENWSKSGGEQVPLQVLCARAVQDMDTNNNGAIDKDEFRAAFSSMGLDMSAIPEEKFDKMFGYFSGA